MVVRCRILTYLKNIISHFTDFFTVASQAVLTAVSVILESGYTHFKVCSSRFLLTVFKKGARSGFLWLIDTCHV